VKGIALVVEELNCVRDQGSDLRALERALSMTRIEIAVHAFGIPLE
jgi:hypothetical protein